MQCVPKLVVPKQARDNAEIRNLTVLYIKKCSICLNFIYRYSQVFFVASSCHAADVPSVRDFVPNHMNHVRIWSQPLLLFVPVVLSNLQEELEINSVFNISPHRKFQRCYTYRSTTSNPGNHRAVRQEVTSRWMCGSAHLVETRNFCPYLAVAVAWDSFQACPDN